MTKYELNANERFVEFWSEERLPFEPKAEMLTARNELREKIKLLELTEFRSLIGQYQSTVNSKNCDLDNVLFYNVGNGPFSRISRHGICGIRHRSNPGLSPSGLTYPHFHKYSMEPMSVAPDCESSLTFELETLKKAPSVVDIWYQASVGRLSQAAPKLTGRFEIHIEIPIGDINIAAASKAIIDGIGCA